METLDGEEEMTNEQLPPGYIVYDLKMTNHPMYVPMQPKTHEQRMREKLLEAKRWLTQESPRWKR